MYSPRVLTLDAHRHELIELLDLQHGKPKKRKERFDSDLEMLMPKHCAIWTK